MIWAGRSSVNAVSTLQPPLCITFIPMKMNLPFCFYLSTSFAETANSSGKLKPICFEHRLAAVVDLDKMLTGF